MATPGCVRPARPARWSAEARLTRSVSSRRQPGGRVISRHARQAGIDDDANPVNGDGCLGDGGRQHDLAAADSRRADRGILRARVELAEQRHDVDRLGNAAFEPFGGSFDLALAGQERKHAAFLLRQSGADCRGHCILHWHPGRTFGIADVHAESFGPDFDHRRVAEQSRDTRAIHGRRHDQDAQAGTQSALDIQRQREAEIAVEGTFVKLVEYDGGDARQFRIIEDHPREDAFGDNLDSRLGRKPSLHTDRVTDGAADLFAQQLRHATRRRACGQPARLQQQDSPIATPRRRKKRQRHQRRLAGAGRRDEHCRVAGFQRRQQGWYCLDDGEIGQVTQFHVFR